MTRKDDVEAKLQGELEKSEQDRDFGKIISLTHELTELSEDSIVRFTTDAGIINRLGKELVARQETAVVELIKNAYDADATRVELIFTNTEQPGGTLEILDDGVGMSRRELINGFMRLSSNNKVVNPFSPNYNRTRAGKKGIGRFATQRLGKNLEILTQPENESGSHVDINWSNFRPGTELILIENIVNHISLPQVGTRLVISSLYEKWSDADIRRVFRYVSDILQPFPISKRRKTGAKSDPGFTVHLFRSDMKDLNLIADEQSQILEYSLSVVEGQVDNTGAGTYSIVSGMYGVEKLNIHYTKEGKKYGFSDLRSINFKAYYFTQPTDEEVYPKNLKSHINRILREKGGIRIYRNGFRVPPYGNKNDDWIGLAESTAKRKVLPPHSNSNWIGIVELSDANGQIFEEKSSREGLIENSAFAEMKEFLYKALTETAILIAIAREKKITANQKDWRSTSSNNPTVAIKEVANELDEIFRLEKRNKGSYSNERDRKFNQKRKETLLKQLAKIAYKLIDENAMLRVLASTGITVSEFIHEIHQTIGSISANVFQIKKIYGSQNIAEEYLDGLIQNTERFISYITYFDQAIRENIVRELKPIEVGEVVHKFVKSTKPLASQRGITITCNVRGFDLYTTPMHNSEWTSILSNLYSNSVKAIKRADAIGTINIDVTKTSESIVVNFSDTGDGISKNLAGSIFEPFVTISSFSRDDRYSNDQSGLGLGLKIVRDILNSYGGTIVVDNPLTGFSTTFSMSLPKLAE
jgi:signal transduction histidine kinase